MKKGLRLSLKTFGLVTILIVGYAGYVLLTMGDCYLKDGNYSAVKKISVDVQYAFVNMMTFGEINHANRIDDHTVHAATPFQECSGDISLFEKVVRDIDKQ